MDIYTKLPETDEEVKEYIDEMYTGVRASSAWGLYRARRAQGDSLLDAWEKVLLAVLGAQSPEQAARSITVVQEADTMQDILGLKLGSIG